MLPHAILLLLGSLAIAESTPPCDTSLLRGVSTEEVSFVHDEHGVLNVSCAGVHSHGAITLLSGDGSLPSNRFDSLTCEAVKGWAAYSALHGGAHIADSASPVTISCPQYTHCDPSLIQGVGADEIKFKEMVGHQRSYYCADGNTSLAGINISSDVSDYKGLYESLRCDAEGWYGVASGKVVYFHLERNEHQKKNASSITASCVEYCAVRGRGHTYKKILQPPAFPYQAEYSHEIRCANSDHELSIIGIPARDGVARCTMYDGWTLPSTPGYDKKMNDRSWSSQITQHEIMCREPQGGKRSVRATRTAEGKQEE